jgi:Asp-tRNA(Asn)/Glu-tRNA(Gln) amidotransferase A subunit family amidase
MSSEVARTFARWNTAALASLSESLRSFIARGQAATEDDLAYARARVARIAQRLYPFAEAGALLIGPATLETAPLGIRSTGNALLNRPWSLLGLGVITIPAGFADDGLPVGLQIIDPHPPADRLFPAASLIETVLAHIPDSTRRA